jgi:hypothetical protein
MRKKTNRLMDLMTLPLIVVCCRVLVVVYILCFAFWYMTADGLKDRSGTPLGADFLNVYAAGILTDHGGPQIAYDWGTHRQTEKDIVGYAAPYFAWHYPPPFLAVAALLALAPYLWALALYLTAGFAAYFAVMRRIAPRARASVWAHYGLPLRRWLAGLGNRALVRRYRFRSLGLQTAIFCRDPSYAGGGRIWPRPTFDSDHGVG